MGMEMGTEREGRWGRDGTRNGKRGRQAQAGRAAGSVDEKASVGGACVRVPGFIRRGGCRLGLAPITFGTEETGDWSRL